jgi:hypothetical protein
VTEHTFVRHPEVAIPRPWDYVQFQVERNLHAYLHKSCEKIKNIAIVGANDGLNSIQWKKPIQMPVS